MTVPLSASITEGTGHPDLPPIAAQECGGSPLRRRYADFMKVGRGRGGVPGERGGADLTARGAVQNALPASSNGSRRPPPDPERAGGPRNRSIHSILDYRRSECEYAGMAPPQGGPAGPVRGFLTANHEPR